VIAELGPEPLVYDLAGLTALVDDFVAAEPEDWPTVGQAMLDEALRPATTQGAVQSVVVCGHHDEPKRAWLRDSGHGLASEWYVGPIE
jgi:hypothetical protein